MGLRSNTWAVFFIYNLAGSVWCKSSVGHCGPLPPRFAGCGGYRRRVGTSRVDARQGWEGHERVMKLGRITKKVNFTNWLVVWNFFFIFPYIGNFITPTDEHIFQRGRYTTNQIWLLLIDYYWLLHIQDCVVFWFVSNDMYATINSGLTAPNLLIGEVPYCDFGNSP